MSSLINKINAKKSGLTQYKIATYFLIGILLLNVVSIIAPLNQQASALSEITTTNKGSISEFNTEWALNGNIWSTDTDTYIVTAGDSTYNIYRYNHATEILTSDTGNSIFHTHEPAWTNPAVASSTETVLHYDNQNDDSSDASESNLNIAIAEKITATSILNGAKIDQIDFFVGDAGSPTDGEIQLGVMDATGAFVCNFGTETAASLVTNPQLVTKSLSTGTFCELQPDYYIGVKITTAFVSGAVQLARDNPSTYDGTNSVYSRFNGATWSDTTTIDLNLTVKTVNGEYLLNDDVTDETKQYWKNGADSEVGANFYINLGGTRSLFSTTLYMQTASEIPAQINVTISADTTFDETATVCNLTASAGAQICEIDGAPGVGQYVQFLVTDWGTATRWTVNEVDAEVLTATVTSDAVVSNIDENGNFFALGQVVFTSTMTIQKVNINGTILGSASNSIGATATAFGHAHQTQNRIWFNGLVEASTSDNHFFGSYNLTLGDYMEEDDLSGGCSDVSSISGMIAKEGATGADDRGYALVITDGGAVELCWDETDITNGELTLSAITPPTAAALQLEILNDDKLLAWTGNGLWEIAVPSHTTTQVATTYPTTFIVQGYNQTSSGREYFNENVLYISDGDGASKWYNPSTGTSTNAPALIESLDAIAHTMTVESAAKYYRIGDIAILTATSVGATTWTLEALPTMQTIDIDIYQESLGVPLALNNDIVEDDVIVIQCESGNYVFPHTTILEVASHADCIQFQTLDINTNVVGRELPFQATKDLVWAEDYTMYNIHVTLATGEATDLYAKVKYDGKDVDINNFDATDNVQLRLFYGQCYTLEYRNILTDELISSSSICADDVAFKEDVVATELGFTFWSAPWGAEHTYDEDTSIVTTLVHHAQSPYNYTVIFYNSTDSEIINDPITGASNLDVQTYNLTTFIDQTPIKIKIFNEDGKIFYNQWVDTGGNWFAPIEEAFRENVGDFEGWGLLMFLPVIFAAIFTRNTAGIGGGMIVAFLGVLVTIGLIPLAAPIIALCAFVAIMGILAYRVITG